MKIRVIRGPGSCAAPSPSRRTIVEDGLGGFLCEEIRHLGWCKEGIENKAASRLWRKTFLSSGRCSRPSRHFTGGGSANVGTQSESTTGVFQNGRLGNSRWYCYTLRFALVWRHSS